MLLLRIRQQGIEEIADAGGCYVLGIEFVQAGIEVCKPGCEVSGQGHRTLPSWISRNDQAREAAALSDEDGAFAKQGLLEQAGRNFEIAVEVRTRPITGGPR